MQPLPTFVCCTGFLQYHCLPSTVLNLSFVVHDTKLIYVAAPFGSGRMKIWSLAVSTKGVYCCMARCDIVIVVVVVTHQGRRRRRTRRPRTPRNDGRVPQSQRWQGRSDPNRRGWHGYVKKGGFDGSVQTIHVIPIVMQSTIALMDQSYHVVAGWAHEQR